MLLRIVYKIVNSSITPLIKKQDNVTSFIHIIFFVTRSIQTHVQYLKLYTFFFNFSSKKQTSNNSFALMVKDTCPSSPKHKKKKKLPKTKPVVFIKKRCNQTKVVLIENNFCLVFRSGSPDETTADKETVFSTRPDFFCKNETSIY